MGGFAGSKHVAAVNGNGEVSSKTSASRAQPAEPSPQAFVASFDPDAPGRAQPSQAPRPKKHPASSLHVNRHSGNETLAADWEALGNADMALAEEEEMQLAIAMSSSLGDQRGSYTGSAGGGAQASDGREMRSPPLHFSQGGYPVNGGGGQPDSGDYPEAHGDGRSSNGGHGLSDRKEKAVSSAVKASGPRPLPGLAGDYAWVDNSDFRSPRAAGQSVAHTASAAPRSSSVGSRGASSRSCIVSLPRIGQPIAQDQLAMVKDLNLGFSVPDDERPSGSLGRSASSDVRRVMEDLNIDSAPAISRGLRTADKDSGRFNERFHSCSEAPRHAHGSAQTPGQGGMPTYESPFRGVDSTKGPQSKGFP